MANVDRGGGFIPVMNGNGSPWSGAVSMYLCPSTLADNVFIGDVVTLGGTSGAAGAFVNGIDVEGIPTIIRAATVGTDVPVGVVVGFSPMQSNLEVLHFRDADDTARIAYVVDDPNVVFEVQEDADTTPIAQASIGLNVTYTNTDGNATTGIGGMELDSTSVATTKTLPFKLLRLSKRVDNALYNATTNAGPAKFLVRFNVHQMSCGADFTTGGATGL